MFGKKNSDFQQTGTEASERIKNAIFEQRRALEATERARVSLLEEELQARRQAEMNGIPFSSKVANCEQVNTEKSVDDTPSISNFLRHEETARGGELTPSQHVDAIRPVKYRTSPKTTSDLPESWSEFDRNQSEYLKARIGKEESALGMRAGSRQPLTDYLRLMGDFIESINEDTKPLSLKDDKGKAGSLTRSFESSDCGGLDDISFGFESVPQAEGTKEQEFNFLEYVQRHSKLTINMDKVTGLEEIGSSQAVGLSENMKRAAGADRDAQLDIISFMDKKISRINKNLTMTKADADPYDLDFHVDIAIDSTQIQEDNQSSGSVIPGSFDENSQIQSELGLSQNVSLLALLQSWMFAIGNNKRAIGVISPLEITSDKHHADEVEVFESAKCYGSAYAHNLGKLNNNAGEHANSIFHAFKPKLLWSGCGLTNSLMSRQAASSPFYRWFMTTEKDSKSTVLESFVDLAIESLNNCLARRIELLWKASVSLKRLGLTANSALRNDVMAMTKLYESTGSMLNPSMLASLGEQFVAEQSLQEWLASFPSVKEVRASDIPWADYPFEIILLHLLSRVAIDARISYPMIQMLAMLDLTFCSSEQSVAIKKELEQLHYIFSTHERAQVKSVTFTQRIPFNFTGMQILDSEKIEAELYKNPLVEITTIQSIPVVSGPFVENIVSSFSTLKDRLVEAGLYRKELDGLSKKLQAIC